MARSRTVRLPERLEYQILLVGGDADACVHDLELEGGFVFGDGFRIDGHHDVAFVGELDGIADQVREHLPQAHRIADERRRDLRRDVGHDLEPLLVRAKGERTDRIGDQIAEIERDGFELELARLDLREVQNVVQDLQQRIGRRLHERQALALFAT